MNSFGLGIVLNFTDNASSRIHGATQAFQQMSATVDSVSASASGSINNIIASCYALDSVGSTLQNVGSSILGVYGAVTQSVIDSGMQMQGYRMQLSALYGSVEAGEEKIQEIKDYAMSSVFDIQSLIPAVTMMKAVGIEAMQDITTSSGQHTQKLLDYASDIAAMVPNMRNTYGTGVQAAMGAMKEYIAEGNALSLKRGAGLDITGILGEDKGATMEERARQVADLVEKLNIVGYTANLAGTPTQRLSNMQDALFNSLTKVADSGVFEKYCGLLEKLSNWVFSLVENEETFNIITGVVADAVSTLLSPLESLLDFIIENSNAMLEWVKAHPVLTKNILVAVAAVGAFLVVAGTLMKAVSSVGMAFAGLNFLKQFPSLLGMIGKGFGGLLLKALPLIAIASMFYYAWKENLFGIRDTLSGVVSKVGQSLPIIFDALSDYELSTENFQKAQDLGILPLIETLLDLKYRFEFFKEGFIKGWEDISTKVVGVVGYLTTALGGTIFEPLINKVKEFFDALSNSDTSTWTKLGEGFAKLTASAVGILVVVSNLKKISSATSGIISIVTKLGGLIMGHPVIAIIVAVVGLLVLLYNKCEGFRNAVNEMFSSLSGVFKDTFGSILQSLMGVVASVLPLITSLKDSFMAFLPQLVSVLQRVLEIGIKIIGMVMELVVQLLPSIIQIIGTIMNVIMGLMPVIMEVLGVVFDVIEMLLPIISNLISMLVPFITNLVAMLTPFIDNVLMIIVDLLQDIVPVIMNIVGLILPMIGRIVEALMPIIQTIMNITMSIMGKLLPIIQELFVIVSEIIQAIIAVAMPIITVIVQIVEVIVAILLPIIDVLLVAIGFIIDVILGIVQIVVVVISRIVQVISGIIQVVMAIINAIVQAVMAVVGVIVGIVTTIVTTIVDVIKGIILAVQFVFDMIVNIFSGIVTFFADIFNAVAETVTGIFQSVGDFFTNMWNGIVGAFNAIGDTISGAIRSAVNGVLGGAIKIINGFIEAINFCIGIINAIPGVSITKLSLLAVPQLATGGVVDEPTLAEIGEDGAEAVVPLERNTGWIDGLAEKVAPKIVSQQTPVASQPHEENYDYSVTFSAGSIVIQLANATDMELEKAAEKIMKIIERKQQLKQMAVRA